MEREQFKVLVKAMKAVYAQPTFIRQHLEQQAKDAILEKLDEISGFTPSMEDVAKN